MADTSEGAFTTADEITTASVVVVNWKQPALTIRSIESLLGQETRHRVEIVIVENEALPGSADELREAFPEAVVVENPLNEGFAGGVTRGIAAASGAVIVLLNNDAVAQPGFLDAGLDRLAREPASVAAVAAWIELEGEFVPAPEAGDGVLVGVDGEMWRRASMGETGIALTNSTGVVLTRSTNCFDRDWLTPVAEQSAAASTGRAGHPLFAFTGGAVFLRRAVLDELGGFDTRFFMYYEDVDLSWRLRLAGYDIVFEPAARVLHRHAGSSDHNSPLIRAYSMRNRTLTALKNAPVPVAAAVVARSVARSALDLAARLRGRGASAQLDGAGWRLYFGTLVRVAPGVIRGRRGVSRLTRRRVFDHYAI